MSRKPGAKQAGKKKPTTPKKKPKHDIVGEETPITISGGSILVESVIDREETGVSKHKKCKINDVAGKKWTPIRVELHAKGGGLLQSILMSPDDKVVVYFERPL